MLLALLLTLCAPIQAASDHQKEAFVVKHVESVVRVPAAVDSAHGDAECVVHIVAEPYTKPQEPTIVDCPDAYTGPVLAAARRWEIGVNYGRTDILGIVLVRADDDAPAAAEKPPRPPGDDQRAPLPRPGDDSAVPEVHDITRVLAEYPREGIRFARKLRRKLGLDKEQSHLVAACRVRIIIDEQGVPTDTDLNLCPELFRESADTAARQWRFPPTRVNGEAVKATYLLTYNYVQQ